MTSPSSSGDEGETSLPMPTPTTDTSSVRTRTWYEWYASYYGYWFPPTTPAITDAVPVEIIAAPISQEVASKVVSPSFSSSTSSTTTTTTTVEAVPFPPSSSSVTATPLPQISSTPTPILTTRPTSLPSPLRTDVAPHISEELFTSLETVASHAFIGFLVGSVAAWSKATGPSSQPKPSSRRAAINSELLGEATPLPSAIPAATGAVRYEAVANHVAKSGAQLAALAGTFSGALALSEHFRQQKDSVTYAIAGAATGLVSAFFIRPFQAKVFLKNPALLGLASAAYARVADDIEGNSWLSGKSKSSGNSNSTDNSNKK